MYDRSFRIRRFEMSDVSGVIKLLELVFQRPFSTEWWNWKYRSNPAGFLGDKGDIWVAESANGAVIGHWAVIPEKIKLGSKTIIVAQGVDAATHPDYRRLGINKTLAVRVLLDVRSRYRFIFGFPREVLYKYRSKHGWKCLSLSEYLSFLNYDNTLRSFFDNDFLVWFGKSMLKTCQSVRTFFSNSFVKSNKVNDIEIQKIDKFPDEMDNFWKSVRQRYEMCIERTASFLNWRFSRHLGDYRLFLARSINYKHIIGYLALKETTILNIPKVLDIVDLQTSPGENNCALNLIDFAKTFARNERFNLVHCRIPAWHNYAKLLSRRRFISIDHLLGLMRLPHPHATFYFFEDQKVTPNFKKWFYMLGDTDYA